MERYLGESIPKLGFGLMRLPKTPGGSIDIDETSRMVDAFMDAGLTYFDTAYVYDDGDSERAAKAALVDRYPRERFQLATKANAWLGKPTEDEVKHQIEVSLERTGAGYFDFYLLHAVQTNNIDQYNSYGLWDYARQLKERGLVRHWGFSFHAGPELLDELLTAHPDAEFVQLQLNYADWENPTVTSRANYEVARAHGVPIVVMEPVKGGVLANPPESVAAPLLAHSPQASLASWAIRYVASLDGIITVLSGMSTMEQVEDNVSYMTNFQPLSDDERATIAAAQEALAKVRSVPCTACHYCTSGCPMNIPIPSIFSAHNRNLIWGDDTRAKRDYLDAVGKDGAGKASDCIACGQCEGACPQSIPIISWLEECAAAYEA